MTAMEQQLLDALQRLEQHYSERDAAMLRRLQTLTARVDALSAQVEQLAQALRQLDPWEWLKYQFYARHERDQGYEYDGGMER